MCTLAFYFQVFSRYPIVAAANRDESLTRPSATPLRLWTPPGYTADKISSLAARGLGLMSMA